MQINVKDFIQVGGKPNPLAFFGIGAIKHVEKMKHEGRNKVKSLNKINNSNFNTHLLLTRAFQQLGIDLHSLTIDEETVQKIAAHIEVHISVLQAKEAVFEAHGGLRTTKKEFQFSRLVDWFAETLPILRPLKAAPSLSLTRRAEKPSTSNRYNSVNAGKNLDLSTRYETNDRAKTSNFQDSMNRYFNNAKQLPSITKKVENTIYRLGKSMEETQAQKGFEGSEAAKFRIAKIAKDNETTLQKNLDFIIKTEKDALQATNLYRLLSKDWMEYKNSYKLMSKITPKMERRLREIVEDRR